MAKRPSNDKIKKLLETKMGNVTDVSKAIKINRATFYKWLNADEKLKEIVEDQKEANIDFAESQLRKLMTGYTIPESKVYQGEVTIVDKHIGPDTGATIFYLKTQGKHRGYVERSEYGYEDIAEQINFNLNIIDSPKKKAEISENGSD